MNEFYTIHEDKGFKKCQCSSCSLLLYPIMIKATRNYSEYEELHRKFLMLVKMENQNMPEIPRAR